MCMYMRLMHGSCETFTIGDVYNITQYLSFHPGGRNELMKAAGTDCTLMFNQVRDWSSYERGVTECHAKHTLISVFIKLTFFYRNMANYLELNSHACSR